MKIQFLLLSFLCIVASTSAQVTFTFTATANTPSPGYTAGQAYTFSFTTPAVTPIGANCSFDDTFNVWLEADITDPELFKTISGSGLQGAYQRPITTPTDVYNFVYVFAPDTPTDLDGLQLSVYSIDSQNIGLTTLAGTQLYRIDVSALQVANFYYPETSVDVNGYFTGYTGTYAIASGQIALYGATPDLPSFTVTSLTISAIPEPSTYALVLGGASLVILIYRRRLQVA